MTTTADARKDTRNGALLVAAALTIAAGALSLFNGVEGLSGNNPIPSAIPGNAIGVVPACGVLLLIFGAVAVSAGIYAFRVHPHISFPLAGAVLGLRGGGDFGFVLGLAAIFLYWLSNEDL